MPKASPSFLAQFKYITGGMTNSNDTPGIRNQDSGRAETWLYRTAQGLNGETLTTDFALHSDLLVTSI